MAKKAKKQQSAGLSILAELHIDRARRGLEEYSEAKVAEFQRVAEQLQLARQARGQSLFDPMVHR